MADKLQITLTKSLIGSTKRQMATVKGLGLSKINSTSVLKNSPEVRGMINKVGHLLKVEKI